LDKYNLDIQNDALFSPCGLYRWWLTRKINKGRKSLIFIGLNPSKADSHIDDQALRRLVSSCRRWNYGSLIVVNLFGRVSKSPLILHRCLDPVGEGNDFALLRFMDCWSNDPNVDLWLGWGNKGCLLNRNVSFLKMLKPYALQRHLSFPEESGPQVIGLTKSSQPRHPLYTSNEYVLKSFNLL